MNYPITISPEFLEVLKSLLKIYNDLPNKKHALFFKKDDNVYVSAMSLNTLVTVKTTDKHIKFDDNEIGISNLTQFLHYIEAIDYPKVETSEILNVRERSTKNKDMYSFLFNGKRGSYRMPISSPSSFGKEDRKIPNDPDKDPLKLVAKFSVNAKDASMLVKDLALMNKPKNFILSVIDNKIHMYMKGSEGQQFTKIFEGMDAKVLGEYTTIRNGKNEIKLFASKIIDYMGYLGCDFETEIRVTANDTLMGVKCRGVISNPDVDDIHVFVGTQENSSDVSGSNLELVQ